MCQRRNRTRLSEQYIDGWNFANHDYLDAEAKKMLRDYIRSLINRLSYREKEVIKLRFYKQLTFQNIAKAFGCSENEIIDLYTDAMTKIRTMLDNDKEGQDILRIAGWKYNAPK